VLGVVNIPVCQYLNRDETNAEPRLIHPIPEIKNTR